MQKSNKGYFSILWIIVDTLIRKRRSDYGPLCTFMLINNTEYFILNIIQAINVTKKIQNE